MMVLDSRNYADSRRTCWAFQPRDINFESDRCRSLHRLDLLIGSDAKLRTNVSVIPGLCIAVLDTFI